MGKAPSFQFYPGDWIKDPHLSACNPSTRGIWIDLLCAMWENDHSGEITGTCNQLARMCRCSPDEMKAAIDELRQTVCAHVTFCNENVTLICRRMQRDNKARLASRNRVAKHRCNANVTVPSSSSSSSSTSVDDQKAPKLDAEEALKDDAIDGQVHEFFRTHQHLVFSPKAAGHVRWMVEQAGWDQTKSAITDAIGRRARDPTSYARAAITNQLDRKTATEADVDSDIEQMKRLVRNKT